jgi:hypothetical protein
MNLVSGARFSPGYAVIPQRALSPPSAALSYARQLLVDGQQAVDLAPGLDQALPSHYAQPQKKLADPLKYYDPSYCDVGMRRQKPPSTAASRATEFV